MRSVPRTAILCAACAACAVVLSLLASCATQPPAPMIPEGLTVGEIFQRAQDAADKGDYSLATAYYTDFQQKYPEDTQHGVWASYEIAFIAHKTGRNDTALSLLDALLARYAKEGDALPPAPRTLAENLKARLEADSPKKS